MFMFMYIFVEMKNNIKYASHYFMDTQITLCDNYFQAKKNVE